MSERGKARGKLLILTDSRRDGAALSEYQQGMLNGILAFAKQRLDPWEAIKVAATTDPVESASRWGADEVMLLGRRLAPLIAEMGGPGVENLKGPMLYGLMVSHQRRRWIASPAMHDYSQGDAASWRNASVMGHAYQHLELLHHGYMGWCDPSEPSEYRLVRSMDDWAQLRRMIESAETLAIDTETTSLRRLGNTVLTIQFGCDGHTGWVLPIAHSENPLSPRDMRVILAWLKGYFERGRRVLHVYANCFHPDTLIETADGLVPIKDVYSLMQRRGPDDPVLVYSYNHAEGAVELQPIQHASSKDAEEEMLEIEYEGGTLRVTASHKVWSATRCAYIEAREIMPDEEILLMD